MKLGTQMDKRMQKPSLGLSSVKPAVFGGTGKTRHSARLTKVRKIRDYPY